MNPFPKTFVAIAVSLAACALSAFLSPHAALAAAATQESAAHPSAPTSAPAPEPKPIRLEGAGGRLVMFSGDGSRLLTAGGREARVWDVATAKPITSALPHEDVVAAGVISRDGKRAATAAGKHADLWDADSGKRLRTLAHGDAVLDVAISRDGRRIATGCGDQSARIWDAATGALLGEMKHAQQVISVQFSPDGRRLLVGTAIAGSATDPLYPPADGTVFRGDALVWDVAGDHPRQLWQFKNEKQICSGRPAFSLDGKRVGIACAHAGVFEYDAESGKRLAGWYFFTGWRGAYIVDFTREGRLFMAGDDGTEEPDAAVRLLKLRPTRPDEEGFPHSEDLPSQFEETAHLAGNCLVRAAAISPDGRWTALLFDAGAQLWDVAAADQRLELDQWSWPKKGPQVLPSAAAFSPDSKRLAVGGIGAESPYTTLWTMPKAAAPASDPRGPAGENQ